MKEGVGNGLGGGEGGNGGFLSGENVALVRIW